MNLLCKLFGHTRRGGWFGDGLYGRVEMRAIDNLDTMHFVVTNECDRCGETYHLARFHHQPVLAAVERFMPRQSTERVIELIEANNHNVTLRRDLATMLRRASARLREESAWVLRNDLDMKFRADCPDEDPEDLADEIDQLLETVHAPRPTRVVD